MKQFNVILAAVFFFAVVIWVAARIVPDHEEASLVYELSGHNREAVRKYKQHLAKKGIDKNRLRKLAELQTKANMFSDSIATYQRIVEIYGPDQAVGTEQLRLIMLTYQGDFLIEQLERRYKDFNDKQSLEALVKLYSSFNKWDREKWALKELIAKEPGKEDYYLMLISLHQETDDAEEIIKTFDLMEQSRAFPREKKARNSYLLEKAYYYGKLGEKERQLAVYKRLVSLNPQNRVFVDNLLNFYSFNGQVRGQIGLLKNGINAFPGDGKYVKQLLDVYSANHMSAEMEQLLKQQIERRPSEEKNYLTLISLYQQTGDNRAIIRTYDLMEQNGAFPRNRKKRNRLLQEKAYLYAQMGKPERQISVYRKLVSLNPHDPVFVSALLDVYSDIGEHNPAVSLLDSLIKNNSPHYSYYDKLLKLLAGRGRPEKEIEVYRAIARNFPDKKKKARERLAGLYISTGQYEKAAEIYREAYRRDRHKTDGLLVLADAALWKQDPQLAEDMLLKARKIHGPDRTLDLKLADIYLQTEQQDKVIQVYQNLNKQGMLKLEDKLKLLQYYIWFGRMGDFYDWGMKLPLAEIPGEYLIPLYQIARQRWDYREAAGILEQRAKSEESKDTLLLERYKLEKDFGNIEESLRLARQLYHKNPNLGNYLELTSLYSADQSLDQLLDLQEKRFLANPNDFKLAEELYNNYYWNKNTSRGIKYLNSVLASHPGNIPVLTFLGRLHYLTKEFAQAASYYQQIGREKLGNIELEQLIFIYHIQKDWPRKLAALQELYRRLPNAPILLRVARTRILMKDFPGALALYRRYLNEHSGNLLAKMEYVSLLEKTGKKKEANIQLDAIKKRKLTPTQLLSFARFTYEIKSFSHSRWAYMKLLRQNDKPDEALLRMGLMANSEDKYLEAVSYYKRYLAYFPPNPIVLFYLAEIRFQQNNMVEANRYYQKAEALLSEKRNPDLFEAQMRAKATYRLGKREQAFNMYQELIKKYPLDQSSLMDYLELLVEDRSYETALLEIKKRRPKPELRLTQIESRIYQELGNHDQAIKLLKEAEKKYPDKIWIKMRIASNYFLWGKRVNSLYYLQEAEKLHPADKYYLAQDKANTLKDYADAYTERFYMLARNNSEKRLHLTTTGKTYVKDRWFVSASHDREWSRRGKLRDGNPGKSTRINANIFDLSTHYRRDSYSDYYGGIVHKYRLGGYFGSDFRIGKELVKLRLGYREPWNDFYEIRYRRGEQSTIFGGISGKLPLQVLPGNGYYSLTAYFNEFYLEDQTNSTLGKKARDAYGYAKGGSINIGQNLRSFPLINITGNFDWFYASLNDTSLVPVAVKRAAIGASATISDQFMDYWNYFLSAGYENNLELMVHAGFYSLGVRYQPSPNCKLDLGYRHEKSLLTLVFGLIDQYYAQLNILY